MRSFKEYFGEIWSELLALKQLYLNKNLEV